MRPAIFTLVLLLACDDTTYADPCHEQQDEVEPDDLEIGCNVIACAISGEPEAPMICEVEIDLEPGHLVDFAIESSGFGALPWNQLPWDVEAGEWEQADYVGVGSECGIVSLNTAAIVADTSGERWIDVVCEDVTAGAYASTRVYLSDVPVL